MPNANTIDMDKVERELADNETFGSWHVIVNRVLTFYSRGVEELARSVPAARTFAERLSEVSDERRYRVLGDPVVRAEVNAALARLKVAQLASPDAIESVLNAALPFFDPESTESPTSAHTQLRIGSPPMHVGIWRSNANDTGHLARLFQELFQREVATSISSRPAVLRAPTESMKRALDEGHDLLQRLLPRLSKSLLAHVHLIAVVDTEDKSQWDRDTRPDLCQSVSTHVVPGTIFLSPSVLRTPWHAAEALLHEAAHKKLSDLVLTRYIFRPGFSAASSPTIRALWNRNFSWNSNDWSIDRALFALHFYVHAALLYRATDQVMDQFQSRFGPCHVSDANLAARGALERAHYLAQELRDKGENELEEDGRAVLGWLAAVTKSLDPSPPPGDRSVNLLLDRFDRETDRLGSLIANIPAEILREGQGSRDVHADYTEWSVRRIVDHLVHSEIVGAYRVLSILGECDPPQFSFYDGDRWSTKASSESTPTELAEAFRGTRVFLSKTLRAAAPEAFTRKCKTRREKTLREIVEDVVEHAGRHANVLLRRIAATRASQVASGQ